MYSLVLVTCKYSLVLATCQLNLVLVTYMQIYSCTSYMPVQSCISYMHNCVCTLRTYQYNLLYNVIAHWHVPYECRWSQSTGMCTKTERMGILRVLMEEEMPVILICALPIFASVVVLWLERDLAAVVRGGSGMSVRACVNSFHPWSSSLPARVECCQSVKWLAQCRDVTNTIMLVSACNPYIIVR